MQRSVIFTIFIGLLFSVVSCLSLPNPKPLFEATGEGDIQTVKKLLDESMDVDTIDHYQQTPLMAVSFYGHTDIAKMLVDKGADIHHRDINGWTALMQSSRYGNYDIAKLLLDKGSQVNNGVIMGSGLIS